MRYNFSIDENTSKYHKKVIGFIRKEFPLFSISQESSIKMDNRTLFCDIMINSPVKIIIEINPTHHYKFTPHFHKTQANFEDAQKRDKLKKKWASINDYILIILKEKDFEKDKFKNILKEILG